MLESHTVTANGAVIPAIGLGTWSLQGETCSEAVRTALAAGYRHIDTAPRYENEEAVGAGLRAAALPRQEVFVTTKVWWTDLRPADFARSVDASLARLKLDQVDLLLIHWPNPEVPLADTIASLCAAKRRGLARHIGVSNFPVALIEEAVRLATEPLVCNQCEYHPYLNQTSVLRACRAHGMALTAYCPLGLPVGVLNDPVVRAAAERHHRSPAQIVLRWHMQQPGIIAIPRSGNPQRIAENIRVFDFTLSPSEMEALSGLARANGRIIAPSFAPQWDAAA